MMFDTKKTVRAIFLGIAMLFVWAIFGLNEADAAILARPVTNLGLVGYWSMNEGVGTQAGDSSGKKNTGTLTGGPTWVDGKRGKALNFDGSDDYVNLGSAAAVDNIWTNGGTASAWIYPRTYGQNSRGRIFDKMLSSFEDGWLLFLQNGAGQKTIAFQADWSVDVGGLVQWCAATTTQTFPTMNKWTHVAVTYIPSGQPTDPTFYIDGVAQSISAYSDCNQTGAGVFQSDAASNLYIGDLAANTRTFDGLIDEARLYKRILSATEIQALYKSGAATVGKTTKIHKDITFGALTSGSQFNTDPSTTASVTPGANKLILAAVATNNSMAAPTLSGNGLTWVQIATTVGSSNRTTLYRAMGSSPTAGAITIDFTGTPNEVRWSIVEFGNVDTSGTNGSGAIVQSKTGSNAAVSSFTITLDSVPSSNSAMYGVVNIDTGTAVITPGTGFTEIHDHGTNLQQESEYKITGDQTVDWTSSGNEDWRGVAVEIKKKPMSIAVNTSQNDQITNGLVGLWSFNGPDMSGNTAYDRSGQGNNGTLTNGPVRAPGKVGQALNFDGGNDYVNLGDVLTDSLATMSVCAWAYHNSLVDDDAILAKRNLTDSAGFVFWRDDVGISRNDTYAFYVKETAAAGDSNARVEGAANTSVANSWAHVCATMALNSSNGLNLYINGALDPNSGVSTVGITNIDGLTQSLTIGEDLETTRLFKGLIDEVRVYNRVLTPAEIKRLYNMGR